MCFTEEARLAGILCNTEVMGTTGIIFPDANEDKTTTEHVAEKG